MGAFLCLECRDPIAHGHGGGGMSDLDRALLSLRMTTMSLNRSSVRQEKEARRLENQVASDIRASKPPAVVETHAQSVVRARSQSDRYAVMAARVEAARSRIQESRHIADVARGITTAARAMHLGDREIPAERIGEVLESFEKACENTDVKIGFVNKSVDESTRTLSPQEDVDAVIQRVGDLHSLEVTALLTRNRVPFARPTTSDATASLVVPDEIELDTLHPS